MTRWLTVQEVLDLFARYPWLWPLAVALVWNVGTGAATWALDRTLPKTDDGWAVLFAEKPRVAALANLLKTAGFNLPGVVRSVRALLAGKPPAWLTGAPPSSRQGLEDTLKRLSVEERERLIALLKAHNDADRDRLLASVPVPAAATPTASAKPGPPDATP
jgi:hypothetical protein